jgi:hypothetical protein
VSLSWCEDDLGDEEWCRRDRGVSFAVCNPTSYSLQTHTLELAGGSIVLKVRMGDSMASTEPAAFISGSGVLDDKQFSQEDYWKPIYRPEHHHFSRDFAVLFDEPISGACGVRMLKLDPWGDSGELPTL